MWAVVPIKSLSRAKQRLAPVLSPSQRRGLFEAMVRDLLTNLRQTPAIDHILLVTRDAVGEQLSQEFDADLLCSVFDIDLNHALNSAAQYVQERGGHSMLVIHGDLPLADSKSLEQLLQQHQQQRHRHHRLVTLVPDRHCQGTNALIASPANAIPFCFENNSFKRHQQQAKIHQCACNSATINNLQHDIDNPNDLQTLRETLALEPSRQTSATAQFLAELDQPTTGLSLRASPL